MTAIPTFVEFNPSIEHIEFYLERFDIFADVQNITAEVRVKFF